MKFNESAQEKGLRLKRCLNALKQADVGRPSGFVGMEVGQAIHINWRDGQGNDVEVEDASDDEGAVSV